MQETKLMKDGLDAHAINRMAKAIHRVHPSFEVAKFKRQAAQGIEALELKARVAHIINCLQLFLPKDFNVTAKILRDIPKVWDKGDPNDALSGFAAWPLIDYVGVTGLDEPDEALRTLAAMTHMFSAEFAIRPLIERHPEKSFHYLNRWISNSDEHIRRLVSEGTRPRLPWGKRLKGFVDDPRPIFPLLTALRNDTSLYVRRSVANNLNDIAKDHPDEMLRLCRSWQIQGVENNGDVDWVIRHAARSLIKAGHPESFALLGFSDNPKVTVKSLTLEQNTLSIGDFLRFSVQLESAADAQRFVLDYAIDFRKANGQLAAKVFKLKNCTLDKHEQLNIDKKHSFKAITTRRYYSGEHRLSLLVNGKEQISAIFTLS